MNISFKDQFYLDLGNGFGRPGPPENASSSYVGLDIEPTVVFFELFFKKLV
jgi:hypothetical protein